MSDPLVQRLKKMIIDELRLEDVTPDDIDDDEPLIGSGLSLDSVDMLELVLKLEKEYGVKIESSEESKKALSSVNSLAAYVRERAQPERIKE